MPRTEPGTAQKSPTVFMKEVMDEPIVLSCADGTAVAFSTPSPTRSTPNEDSAAVIPVAPGTAVLVVADGVGGMKAGHTASASAVRALRKSLSHAAPGDDLRTFILDGIEKANETIIRQGLRAATTLAVVEISDGHMRPYHVGDSIILQVSARGDIKWSALSHAPVSYAVEAGVLTEEEAMLHPERNIISNIVGDRDMWIEIGPRRKLGVTDTVVVASDGLCDNLSSLEISDLVRRSPLPRKVELMIQRARKRMLRAAEAATDDPSVPGKPDDLTALVFRRERRRKPRPAAPVVVPEESVPVEAPPEPVTVVTDTPPTVPAPLVINYS